MGRVLVKQGGTWQLTDEVTECTVETANGVVDPFVVAWEALNLGKPLPTVLES